MLDFNTTDLRETAPWEEWVGSGTPNSNPPVASVRLSGKRILITGAGGSIGSALSHAASASGAANLVLLDTSENGLYQIDRSLREAGSDGHVPILGSVCDAGLLVEILGRYRPQIVFHAAALKHVPLMEQNPFAAIQNNALGTYALAKAAVAHGVEQMVLVSTDKAVDPASIMGASKRIAEFALLVLAGVGTRMTAVRLCNVLGSQGSVLPLFQEQIAQGGPLTVTHRDASRYFMTIDRAVALLFEALGSWADGTILLPEPGAAVRIMELAERLISAQGSSAAIDITGLRPGEKLSERLLSSSERVTDTSHAGPSSLRMIVSPLPSRAELEKGLLELAAAVCARDLGELLRAVFALVPEYQPSVALDPAARAGASEELIAVMQA